MADLTSDPFVYVRPSHAARVAVRSSSEQRCPVCGRPPVVSTRVLGALCVRSGDAEHEGYLADVLAARSPIDPPEVT